MNIWTLLEYLIWPMLWIDNWLLKRTQSVADWAYTYWEVSPWRIAANLFCATALLQIIAYGLDAMSAKPTSSLFFTALNTIFDFLWFLDACGQHQTWVRTKLSPPPNPSRIISRITFLFLSELITAIIILGAINDTADLSFAALYLSNISVTAGFFFQSCVAPTPKQRRAPALRLDYAKT